MQVFDWFKMTKIKHHRHRLGGNPQQQCFNALRYFEMTLISFLRARARVHMNIIIKILSKI